MPSTSVLFFSTGRYADPLDGTAEKKFRALSALGDLRVMGFSTDGRLRRFKQHADFYLVPSVDLPVARYMLWYGIVPIWALWCILRCPIDILVAQSPYRGLIAALIKGAARLVGKRVALVVECHGDFEDSVFMQRRVRPQSAYRFLMPRVARFALRRADTVRCISTSTREQLMEWAPDKPMVQFATWTDMEAFLRHGSADPANDREKIILYAGVLIPRKGVHFLIDAFAAIAGDIPEAQLWLIGKAENLTYAADLQEQAQRLGIAPRIQFLDALPQDELADRMARAAVFVLPSVSEGLGRVVFEAMACGTPVIGSHVGGIPDMVHDGDTGFLVAPGDVGSLGERLRWFLTQPQAAREMGARARQFAERFFSPEGYVQQYGRLFDQLRQL